MSNKIVSYLKTDEKFKIVLFAALAIIAVVILKACDKRKVQQITDDALTNEEKQAIIVDDNGNVTTVDRNGNKTRVNIDHGVRDVRISVDKNNHLNVLLRDHGFIHEAGIGVLQTANFRGILDLQWFFYHQYGVNSGLSFSTTKGDQLRVYVGAAYTLPWEWLSNTSVLLTYDTKREIGVGLRVRF